MDSNKNDQSTLAAIHAAMLLGKPVQLPPGTRLAIHVNDAAIVEVEVSEGRLTQTTWSPSANTVLIYVDYYDNGGGIWFDVQLIHSIISVPDGVDVASLLAVDI